MFNALLEKIEILTPMPFVLGEEWDEGKEAK